MPSKTSYINIYSVNMLLLCDCSDFFETFQGLIHADKNIDLDIKAREQLHHVVLQLEFGTKT